MANNFQIVISATDRATSQIRKVNDSLSRMGRPIREAQKSFRALGKEAGLDKLGKSLSNVGARASVVASKIGSIAAPMLALVGGGTLAGLAAITDKWAQLVLETARSAQTIGMSVEALQALRGAAAIAGVSADTLTGGLKALGDTMEDALYGRNAMALGMLSRFRIGIHKTADGAIDTTRALRDMSGVISRIKSPQVQGLVARQFGVEALLPILRQGPAALAAYQARARELGGVQTAQAIARAAEFGAKLNELGIATGGLRNAIGEKLIPVLQPLLDKWTKWIVANRELIATKVEQFVRGLASWLDRIDLDRVLRGIESTITGIGKFVDAIGGWKVAAIGLVAVMNLGLIDSVVNLGAALVNLSVVGVPVAVRALGLLDGALGGAGLRAVGLLGALGKLGLAAAAGFAVGEFLVNPLLDNLAQAASGNKDGSFGTWLADIFQKDPNQAPGGLVSGGAGGGQPIGIRNNNPGNLRNWAGAGSRGGFAVFPTAEAGIGAAARNLQLYGQSGIHTLAGVIGTWAPPSDHNDTGAYIADVSRQTGINPRAYLNLNDPKVVAPLLSAMIRHENGKNPYDQDMINKAVASSLQIHVKVDAPRGTQVAVRSTGTGAAPKVSTSVPTTVPQ